MNKLDYVLNGELDNCKGKDMDYKFVTSSRGLAVVLEIVFSVKNENLQKGLCSDVMNQGLCSNVMNQFEGK